MINRREIVIGVSAVAATCVIEPVQAMRNWDDCPIIEAAMRAGMHLDIAGVPQNGRKLFVSLNTAQELCREFSNDLYPTPKSGHRLGMLDRFEVIVTRGED